MALYRHVGDKQGLLDGIVERLLDELGMPDAALPWPERLAALTEGMRAAARRHPEAFGLLLRRPLTTPAAVARRAALYAGLRDAGVPDADVPRVERLLSTFLLGFAFSEVSGRFASHERAELDADLAWVQALARAALEGGALATSPHVER